MAPRKLKVMIMNTGKGPDTSAPGAAETQKEAIGHSISTASPDLVLCQEWNWGPDKDGYTRLHRERYIGDEYIYISCKEGKAVGILYNKERVNVTEINDVKLPKPRRQYIPVDNSFSIDERMCKCKVEMSSGLKCIIFAYHGPAYRSGMNRENKIKYFQRIMKFLYRVKKTNQRVPVICAGDFNVNFDEIEELVKAPFKVYRSNTTERRREAIDFYIASSKLQLTGIKTINISNVNRGNILDHDPIVANVKFV